MGIVLAELFMREACAFEKSAFVLFFLLFPSISPSVTVSNLFFTFYLILSLIQTLANHSNPDKVQCNSYEWLLIPNHSTSRLSSFFRTTIFVPALRRQIVNNYP